MPTLAREHARAVGSCDHPATDLTDAATKAVRLAALRAPPSPTRIRAAEPFQ